MYSVMCNMSNVTFSQGYHSPIHAFIRTTLGVNSTCTILYSKLFSEKSMPFISDNIFLGIAFVVLNLSLYFKPSLVLKNNYNMELEFAKYLSESCL